MRWHLIVSLMFIVVSPSAHAFLCIPKTTQETLQDADYVFEGLPLTWDFASDHLENWLGQRDYETKFLVKKRFKGQLPNEVLVQHPGPGANGGIGFEIGKPVLVVASQRGDKLFTSVCGDPAKGEINGGKLEDFEDDLRKFKETQASPVYNFPG